MAACYTRRSLHSNALVKTEAGAGVLILLRRSFAAFLTLLFVFLFALVLLVFRINGSFLEPSFYTGTLSRLDFYNFVYDTGIAATIDENDVDIGALPLGDALTVQETAGYAERVLPPDWLQENFESAIVQLLPYLTGETDEFTVSVPLGERIPAAVEVVKEVVTEGDVYGYVITDVVAPEVEQNADTLLGDLPYGLELTQQEVLDAVREVMPKAWFDAQVVGALDEVTPYLTGQREEFSITIELQDQTQTGLDLLERWLQESFAEGSAYDYLLEDEIAPVIRDTLGATVTLPFGVTLEDDDIVTVIGGTLNRGWVGDRITDAFGALGPYLTGETNTFAIGIPLRGRAALAMGSLEAAVDAKYETIFDALPTCTPAQLITLVLDISLTAPPPCLPPLITYEGVKSLVGLNVLSELTSSVVDALPVSITVTEEQVLAAIGVDLPIETTRETLRDGLVFTEQDLRKLILEQGSQETLDLFDDVRGWLRDGFTYSDQDLREDLDPADMDAFNRARGWIDTGRSLLWLLLVVLAVFAAGVGFLGGRNWWSRLIWAGAPVLLAGAIVVAAIGFAITPGRDAAGSAIDTFDIPAAVEQKIDEVADDLFDTLAAPVRTQGIIAVVIGLAAVGAGVYGQTRQRGQTSP